MRLPNSEARAFVFGPLELAELLAAQFNVLGIRAETAPTPATEEELYSWLSAHGSEISTFIHPGLSAWADGPEFPQIVSSLGFFPVSPSAKTLSLCLNKLNLMIEAEAAGIRHLAVSLDPLSSLREIEMALAQSGEKFPIVLKSLKVTQGHGTQVIRNQKELREIVPSWFEQLARRYSEASVIIERCLPSARHLVVPFAADGDRFLEIFPLIDASLQTRWRRLIQFIPASGLDEKVSGEIQACVRKWVNRTGFSGFGSMEFLVEGPQVYMINANARLNAAFPFWEELLGVRTVEWQLAGLGQLAGPPPVLAERPSADHRTGIALRFYCEDPIRQIPCPGKIRELTPSSRWKDGDASVTWMTRFHAGDTVSWTSSGVLGELFVLGKDRKSTIRSAIRALRQIWIAGEIQTNQRFLLEHLEHPFVRENLIHAGFTDEDFVPEAFPETETVLEIVSLADRLFTIPGSRWIAGNQWIEPAPAAVGRVEGLERFDAKGSEGAFGAHRIGSGDSNSRFHFEPVNEDRWLVNYETWTLSVRRVRPGARTLEGGNARIRKIMALAPGRVHALFWQPGETLRARDRVCLIESMRILVPHSIPVPARLIEWRVAPGEVVETGRELAVFELLS